MAGADDDPIWYASYGSNCLSSRFEAYLTGGTADGATRAERGARDRSPPAGSAGCWLPHPVRFFGDSAKWGGGGVAFLDHGPGRSAPARRYLITRGQFAEVAAQESGRPSRPLPIDDLAPGSVHPIGDGGYDGLLALDPIDGVPVLTFTSPHPLVELPPRPPSAAYLGTIVRGLVEVHPDPIAPLVEALLDAPGVAEGWTAASIRALVAKKPIESCRVSDTTLRSRRDEWVEEGAFRRSDDQGAGGP